MKRTVISNMSPEEAADELAMMEIKKLLQKARKAYQKADEAASEVFNALEDMCLDLDVPSAADNAYKLQDAVTCYLRFGEYSLRKLLQEIRAQYTREED